MFPYYLLFGTFAVGAVSERGGPHRSRASIFYVLAGLCLTLMVGLRYHVGVDWTNYQTSWQYASETDLQGLINVYHGSDPIFYALVWFLRNYGLEYWALNLICATIFSCGLLTFANRQPNRWLAVAVAIPYLVIVIAMSGLRQATAIGFVFLALVAFTDRSAARFLFFIACGAAFHASAILVVPFAGMLFARNRFQSVLLLTVTAVAAYFLLKGSFNEYATDYIITPGHTAESSGTIYRIAMNLVPALIFLRYKHHILISERDKALWRNFALVALGSVFIYYLIPSSTALDRVLLYLYPMQMFVLSRTPFLMAGEGNRAAYISIILLILIYLASLLFVFLNFGVNSASYIPYRFYPLEGGTLDAY